MFSTFTRNLDGAPPFLPQNRSLAASSPSPHSPWMTNQAGEPRYAGKDRCDTVFKGKKWE